MVQGGMSVVKCLLFVFNFIFVVCGIALIAIGAVAQTDGKQYTQFLGAKFMTAPTILIIIGCAVFLIAFLGCWGAMKQNYCMVTTFGILLMIIFVIEISGGIVAYVYQNQINDLITDNMLESIKQNTTDFSTLWNEVQIKWDCCGARNYTDYIEYGKKIPSSCCGNSVKEKDCKPDDHDFHKEGCQKKLVEKFESKIITVGGVGIGIAFIEILGMIFAWCLASAIRKEYEGV